jgi:hypothetical protein
MYPAQDQYAAKNAANNMNGMAGYAPSPRPVSAYEEASDALERTIGEAMSLGEVLAERLGPVLRPAGPMPMGDKSAQVMPMSSPAVDSLNRQRSRVQAICQQLADLLDRTQV